MSSRVQKRGKGRRKGQSKNRSKARLRRPRSRLHNDVEHFRIEMERKARQDEARFERTIRHQEEMNTVHEDQIDHLTRQHQKDLKVLRHQHEQQIRALKQSYEVKIESLVHDQKVTVQKMHASIDADNRAAMESVIADKERQTQEEISTLKAEMEHRLFELEQAFHTQRDELERHKVALQESEAHRKSLESEAVQTQQGLEKSQRSEAELRSLSQDREDELSATQAKLKNLKQEYQDNLKDLKNALTVSKEHLQVNYETLSALKEDKERLEHSVSQLNDRLQHHNSALKTCAAEKQHLKEHVEASNMDAQTYQRKMRELRVAEAKHKEAMEDAGQSLHSRETRIRQCQAALQSAEDTIKEEQQKHMALRQDYQDHMDRLSALNLALDKCRQKNTSANQVLQDMADRHEQLRSKHEKMAQDMRQLHEAKSGYQKDLETERQRVTNLQRDLDRDREQLTEALTRAEHNQKHAYQLLDTCQQKGSACLQSGKARDEYVAKLEAEIKRAMKVLKDDAAVRRKAKRMEDVVAVRDKEAEQLKHQLEKLQHSNSQLKGEIAAFEQHRQLDVEMSHRHSKLKNQHARAVQWISEMKNHHDELHQHENKLGEELKKTEKKLGDSEDRMQKAAKRLHEMESEKNELKKRIAKCLYPGEKERLEAQLMQLIKERNTMSQQMEVAVGKHNTLYQQVQALIKENEDLKVLQSRYELDSQQMQQVVEQGAQLNVELSKSKRQLTKKDKQLELLSNQLASLLHRNKTLEERESTLKEKLGFSASPEEIEALSKKLNSCRLEMKQTVVRYDTLQNAVNNLTEQNRVQKDKIRSLVDVLKDSEVAAQQLQQEKRARAELEHALKRCSEDRQIDQKDLEARIKAVEDQYRSNLVSHEHMMAESNARISELQAQLERAAELERNTRLRARLQGDNVIGDVMVPEKVDVRKQVSLVAQEAAGIPMKQAEALERVKRESEARIAKVNAELVALQKEEQQRGTNVQTAVRAAHLNSTEELQRVRLRHQQAMRDKEREIMEARSQTYDQMLGLLDRANRNGNINPNDLYGQIRDIRSRGAQREQQSMADMLQLRAINQRLGTEYRVARQVQGDMLHRANVTQRDRIIQTAQSSGGPSRQLEKEAQAYQALISAQQHYITSQKQDVVHQLQSQTQYIQDLQKQVPKMNGIIRSINTQRFPNLAPLQKQVQQEKRFTIGALGTEMTEAKGQDRTRSALESQLSAASASMRGMVDQIQHLSRNPNTNNLQNLQSFAQMSPGQIEEALRRGKALKDRSAVRTNYVSQPRIPALGPPGKRLAVDQSTGEVQIKPHGTPAHEPPHRFFADQVSMFGEPKRTFAPTVARATDQVQQGSDLIAVTYSFEAGGQGPNGEPIKYLMFMHALEQLFPKIQALSPNGTLNVQLVKIFPQEQRQDMIQKGHNMTQGCTYRTCNAVMQTLNHVDAALKIMGPLADNFGNGTPMQAENHIVMTLSVPGSTSHIHIADVLYFPTSPGQIAVPPVDQIRLLDSSWITYLSDVLSEKTTKIDMFFNVLPHSDDDAVTSNSNDRLLQVSSRLQDFLAQIKHNQ